MPNLRVIQICPAYHRNPEFGGPVHSASSLTRGLSDLGCSVRIVASWFPQTGSRFFCHSHVELLEYGELLYLGHCGAFRWTSLDVQGIATALRWIRQSNLLICHGYRTVPGTLLTLYARSLGKTCWLYPHGMVGRKLRSLRLKWLFDMTLGSIVLRCFSKVLIHAEIERAEILSSPLRRTQIAQIPPPLPVWSGNAQPGVFRHKYGLSESDIVVTFVGRIIPIKRIELLLEAFTLAASDNWYALIIGPPEDADYARSLRKLAASCRFSQRILFLGPLYGAEKDAAIRDSDVCAVPSAYESFGVFAWEAACAQKPVVLCECCGAVAALPKDLAFVAPAEPHGFAQALRAAVERSSRCPTQAHCAGVDSQYLSALYSALQTTFS